VAGPERSKLLILPTMVDGVTIRSHILNAQMAAATEGTTAIGNEADLNGLALLAHVETVANEVLPVGDDKPIVQIIPFKGPTVKLLPSSN